MKSFHVPIGGSETDEPLFETALAAARRFSGHLQFVHVHVGAGQAVVHTPHTEFAMGDAPTGLMRMVSLNAYSFCHPATAPDEHWDRDQCPGIG
jgi:hypothetical protein